MRKTVAAILTVTCVAGGLWIWILARDSGPAKIDDQRDARAATSSELPAQPAIYAPVEVDARAGAAPKPGLAEQFAAAQDLWQFAESVLPAAKAGDAAAQFHLSEALRYCDEGYRAYFDRGRTRRTLDQALQWASTRFVDMEAIRDVHQKCFRLKESGHSFGTADDWLLAASSKEFPLANMETADLLWIKGLNARGEQRMALWKEAQRLALLALHSKEPEVLFRFGDLAGLFREESAGQEQWVWRLAACQRGFDCSPSSEWLRFHCWHDRNCQPYESGVDYIRRNNPADFDEIETLARDLNEKLDAGQIDDVIESQLSN